MKQRNKQKSGGGLGSLRSRMIIAMLASVALMLPAILISLLYIRRMNDGVRRIISEDLELVHIGERISLDISRARRDDENFMIHREPEYLYRSHEALERVNVLADSGRRLLPNEADRFEEITRSSSRYLQLIDSLAEITGTARALPIMLYGPPAPAGKATLPDSFPAALNANLHLLHQAIVANSDSLVNRAMNRIESRQLDARRLATWGQRNIITVLLLTMIVLVWLLISLPRQAVLPIKRLTNALRRAEQGDLDVRVKLAANDELGNLARQLNRSFARLREFDEQKVERILQLERRFRMLINDISEGVIVVDRGPTILLANQAIEELLGCSVVDAQGRKVQSCPGLLFIVEPLERALAGSTSHQTCDVMPDLPGSAVCIEILRNRAGDITGALIVISNPQRPDTPAGPAD